MDNKTKIVENTCSSEMNLTRFLSSNNVDSRRKCADLIKSGAVKINGTVELSGATIVTNQDQVCVHGHIINRKSKRYYIMLNKPCGFVCTNSDVHAKKKALDLIKIPEVRLFSAGRLDKDSEGLILFSNDGDWVNKLAHPRYMVLKEYLVVTAKSMSAAQLDQIRQGISDDGEFLKPTEVKDLGSNEYLFVLNEGKKREIRRLIAAVNHEVITLRRLSIGQLNLGSLLVGQWRELTLPEINLALRNR